jgi:hypothetical protein
MIQLWQSVIKRSKWILNANKLAQWKLIRMEPEVYVYGTPAWGKQFCSFMTAFKKY